MSESKDPFAIGNLAILKHAIQLDSITYQILAKVKITKKGEYGIDNCYQVQHIETVISPSYPKPCFYRDSVVGKSNLIVAVGHQDFDTMWSHLRDSLIMLRQCQEEIDRFFTEFGGKE